MNVGLLTSESHAGACPYIRVISPLTHLHQRKKLTLVPLGDLDRGALHQDRLQHLDVLVVQRGIPAILSFADLAILLKKPRPKIVYEIDDALTHLPESNPHYHELLPLKEEIFQYLSRADMVTVSTQRLKELYGPHNKNIVVLPNYLDMGTWEPPAGPGIKKPFTLLISGTLTHSGDLHFIRPLLTKLLNRYHKKIKLIQWGVADEKISSHAQVVTMPAVSNYKEYAQRLKHMHVDLALIPLQATPFNQAKSTIKWLEYSICRIPGIYSGIHPYSTVIQHEKTGILVENTVAAWQRQLHKWTANPEGLNTIGENAYNEIKHSHSLADHAQEWLEAYQSLFHPNKKFHDAPAINVSTHNYENKWYRKALTFSGASVDYRATAYVRLGEIAQRNGNKQWKTYFKKALQVLETIHKKNLSQHYRMASAYKKTGDLKSALHYFNEMLLSPLAPALEAGVCFHLGEIYHNKNEYKKARHMFSRCLVQNPAHRKARQYLTGINGDDQQAVTVSIVIPVFNRLDYTRTCLETLYKTTGSFLNFEVIVVDNGSSDGTAAYLNGAVSHFQGLWVISNRQNLGFAAACNQGAEMSRGKYILFLNNDTEPQPHWLPPMLEVLENDETAAIVGSKLLYPDRTIQHAGVIFIADLRLTQTPEPIHIFHGSREDLPPANQIKALQAVTAACLLISKKTFGVLNGFDESFRNGYEDIDLCLRVWKNGLKVVYQPRSVVIHHESKSGIERHLKSKENYDYFHKKWQGELKADYSRDSGRAFTLTQQSPISSYQIPRTFFAASRPAAMGRVLPMKHLSADFVANQYFYIAEQYLQQEEGNPRYYYRRASYLLQQVKDKNMFHYYKLASINKRLQCSQEAIRGFQKVLTHSPIDHLKAGACFHLGEIFYQQQQFEKAGVFFQETLTYNPKHREARRYLEIITGE